MRDQTPPSDQAVAASAFFDGSRLTLARHLAAKRKSELAKAVDKSATAVASWETGTRSPNSANVAELALALGVQPSFFSVRPSETAEVGSDPHFRSLRSTSQLARDQAFAYGRLAADVSATLERHVEFPDVDLPEYPVDATTASPRGPEDAAALVREFWELGLDPVRHCVRLLETHGILVVFSPSESSSVDAYSFSSRLRPVVVLNPLKRDYYRQRFDVAHELGHLVMHGDAEPGGRIAEDQANRFASELLMPREAIESELPTTMGHPTWRALGKLKEHWGASLQALLFRARTLGCLSDVSYRNAMITVSARGWRRAEPGLITTVEQPSLLPSAVELLAKVDISSAILADQCGVPQQLFDSISSRTPVRIPAADPIDEPPLPGNRVVSLFR